MSWILPTISISLGGIAGYAMWVRRFMVDELNKEYIRLARAKGLPSRAIMIKHVMRNAFVPLAQYLPATVLLTIGGSIYIESLYSIPGMGGLLVDAIQRQDNPLVQALVLVYSVLAIIGLFLGDVLMTLFDPRIRLERQIIAMCATGWLAMARFVRNQIVILRDREYNLASRCLGTPTSRIVVRNLLPYLVSVIVLRMELSIPSTIGWEVFLTYIGLGLPLDQPTLGNLLNEGRQVMMAPSLRYQLIFPAAVLSVITVSFYVLGNAFADASDPRNHF